ncbi:15-cis-phytoene desaturase, chloroplastic/chromoplastic isoform X1 [Salvia hispanica]|uniref:15-cis-phytoene desaturase, chloroplastic/chromoplastic isoform X1 n=1 Tax=Salvia hispanica TaxID=49212 RepID=UPI0020099919|nr:15-cis-phytoene desaturase, chloroplastic/chromoplastic isoform X1 [Salvia hispanica]
MSVALLSSLPLSSPIHFPSSKFKSLRPPNATPSQISPLNPTPSPSQFPDKTGVIVIGAGLAGLAAATHLQAENIPFLLLEASDAVGGRVRTDFVDGFTLDRGFQIFITAYPEARKLLDYDALDLQRFYSGAKVFFGGRFHTVADPRRHFSDSLQSLANPIGSLIDKFLIALTIIRVLSKSDFDILTADEVETIELLRSTGYSDSILDRFFRPFFGGIFFDRELETTSRLFDFVFKCLALGDNTLPRNGIAAIPEQLAAKLNPSSIVLNSRVISIDHESGEGVVVNLQSGESLRSDLGVILAIEEFEAAKVVTGKTEAKLPARSTICLYFSVDEDKVPVKEPVLLLNGSGRGIVNNMFFASNVAPSYAPAGKALVSVSLIGVYSGVGEEELVERVVKELSDWFGEEAVGWWNYLRMYRVEFAQPNQRPPTNLLKEARVRVKGGGLYVCGDYVTHATFDGALLSGRRAVEALLKDRAAVGL